MIQSDQMDPNSSTSVWTSSHTMLVDN